MKQKLEKVTIVEITLQTSMYVSQDLNFRIIYTCFFCIIKKASVFRGFEQTIHVCLCISINATSVDRTKTNNATVRPQDTQPQAAWTLTIHIFEQDQKKNFVVKTLSCSGF